MTYMDVKFPSLRLQLQYRISSAITDTDCTHTFAVDCYSTFGLFANLKEILQNQIGWFAAVGEEQLLVIEASVGEPCGIVQFQI